MRERCYSSNHFKWIFLVALPSLILYVVGIPLLGFKLLQRNRDMLQTNEVKKKYSFMYKGYEGKWYFWESVVVSRKVLLVAIAVFFISNVRVQSLLAMLLICCALFLHIYARPFENNLMDWMEFFSLSTSFTTFWCGQFLFVPDINEDARAVWVSILIVLANAAFFITIIVLIAKSE